jgi:Fic family protein
MDIKRFQRSSLGKVVKTIRGYWAFVPNPLPPKLSLTPKVISLLSEADRTLGELAGLGRRLPNPHLLIRPFVRKEATLSSRIEGTQASLSDVYAYEEGQITLFPQPPSPDVKEVVNYVDAMEHGLKRIETLPLSLRLIRELHGKLMKGVRGEHGAPGEFRRSQNWIGSPGCKIEDATFVPPPVDEMHETLGAFERFLHSTSPFPPLINLALVHYQFEAIHPFIDGNGRIGRLLIILLLCHHKLLPEPLLYLSAFFEKYRDDYYRLLLSVSEDGRWEDWILFFLRGVITQSKDATLRSQNLLNLQEKYRQRYEKARSPGLLLLTIDELFARPIITIGGLKERLKVTFPSAQKVVNKLVDGGILKEMTGKRRNRVYIAEEILRVIDEPLETIE